MPTPKVGDKVYVRTTRDDWVGKVINVDGPWSVTLKNAAWIADSG